MAFCLMPLYLYWVTTASSSCLKPHLQYAVIDVVVEFSFSILFQKDSKAANFRIESFVFMNIR